MDTSQALLDRLAGALAPVAGVRAVALGGSRGRGVHNAASDYDIGLYYDGELDIAGLERAAQALNDAGGARSYRSTEAAGRPLVTGIGGWGPWVNGGGWLTVDGAPVDLLYRDLSRVRGVIAEVRAGRFECAYHVGHPHAFVSTIYAGEIATCRVLHDPNGDIAAARALLEPYPEALRTATIARFADEARFFLAAAQKAAGKGDVTYVAGCAFRAASCLLQVVFATNRQWLLNEKGALALASTFAVTPKDFRLNLEAAFAELAAGPQGLISALGAIGDLVDEAAG
ncbi:MAG: nucleotidyltransferase domain-containing protein [Rhizomicrobium sp.]